MGGKYVRFVGGDGGKHLTIGDVVTIAGYDGLKFVVTPIKLNRKQDKAWDKAMQKAEALQADKIDVSVLYN